MIIELFQPILKDDIQCVIIQLICNLCNSNQCIFQ